MRTHLMGMGGIGMSGIAQILLARGERVSGCDIHENSLLQQLGAQGAQVRLDHAASHLTQAGRLVYSSSILPENLELVEARNRGLKVLHRGQMVGELLAGRSTIAVTGSHGKSTTSALAAQLLLQAGKDPVVLLGAEVESLGGNAREGKGSFAVVEADESDGSLLWLAPEAAILTNIDDEHLDYFRNRGEILELYAAFAERVLPQGSLIGCWDDPGVRQIFQAVKRRKITYGLSPEAQFRAVSVETTAGGSRYTCLRSGKSMGTIQLQIPGLHNVVNSLSILALAQALKIDFAVARQTLAAYQGAKRRFQIHGEIDGVMIVEDYGHHPTEIASTLAAARSWAGRRIRCVFQPHRYTRTRYLLDRFAQSLAQADCLYLLPIYAASEAPVDGVTSGRLREAVERTSRCPVSLGSPEEILQQLTKDSQPGDLVLFLGAGSVGTLSGRWIQILKARKDGSNGSKSLREGLLKATGAKVKFNEPMRNHTTFHVGGPAEFWVEPSSQEELQRVVGLAKENSLPVTLIGGGANLLVRDEGIAGLVIHLGSPFFQGYEVSPEGVTAGAGLPLEWLIRRSQEAGLSGVEFLAGVPGRVGGAVRMNAGTHDDEGKVHSLSNVIRSITAMNLNGEIEVLPQERIGFRYRGTNLKGWIVLQAALELTPDDPRAVAQRVKRLWEFKRKTQDWSYPSAGCIFKNPAQGPAAGWLIEQVGLKGCARGGAAISQIHANFMVNQKNARACDVLALIDQVREKVRRQFQIELELEVQVIP